MSSANLRNLLPEDLKQRTYYFYNMSDRCLRYVSLLKQFSSLTKDEAQLLKFVSPFFFSWSRQAAADSLILGLIRLYDFSSKDSFSLCNLKNHIHQLMKESPELFFEKEPPDGYLLVNRDATGDGKPKYMYQPFSKAVCYYEAWYKKSLKDGVSLLHDWRNKVFAHNDFEILFDDASVKDSKIGLPPLRYDLLFELSDWAVRYCALVYEAMTGVHLHVAYDSRAEDLVRTVERLADGEKYRRMC